MDFILDLMICCMNVRPELMVVHVEDDKSSYCMLSHTS